MKKEIKETILIENPEKHVIKCTLNRPEAANAFNSTMAEELFLFFESLTLDQKNIRVIILTGAGKKSFCAGGDLKERNGMTSDQWFKQHKLYERMVRSIINCPLPIIAAVNGVAYGGGCELVSAVDFAYAADHAIFAQTETKLGIIPGAGGTQNLPRAIGKQRALELILTGKTFSAVEAKEWGLINELFSSDDLLTKVTEVANLIALNAPIAVKQAKFAINKGVDMPLSEALSLEIEAYNKTVPTDDRTEGILAFNEKRLPKFKGK